MFPLEQMKRDPILDSYVRQWFLLRDPKRWTKGTWARDADGWNVDPDDTDAVCWCLGGAARRLHRDSVSVWSAYLIRVGPFSVADFNDDASTDHADILRELIRNINERLS